MLTEVKKAVDKFKAQLEAEGCEVNLDNVDYNSLLKDVQDEYSCGCDGSIYDVIVDLNDTVGLEVYGIQISG
jgi:hypothetical protein